MYLIIEILVSCIFVLVLYSITIITITYMITITNWITITTTRMQNARCVHLFESLLLAEYNPNCILKCDIEFYFLIVLFAD